MKRKLLFTLLTFVLTSSVYADSAETVAITYRFAKANEAALKATIQQHWSTAQRLDLVTGDHHLYRGDGFYLEIFTWKDAAIPDSAPPEIRKIWTEMQRLSEKLSFEEVHAVAE